MIDYGVIELTQQKDGSLTAKHIGSNIILFSSALLDQIGIVKNHGEQFSVAGLEFMLLRDIDGFTWEAEVIND